MNKAETITEAERLVEGARRDAMRGLKCIEEAERARLSAISLLEQAEAKHETARWMFGKVGIHIPAHPGR